MQFLLRIAFVLALLFLIASYRKLENRRVEPKRLKPLPYLPYENMTSFGDDLVGKFRLHILEPYLEWHRNERIKADSNRQYARSIRILVVKGVKKNAGIGDRIRTVLHSLLAAIVSQRLLLIDLRDPYPINTILMNPKGLNFTHDRRLFIPEDHQRMRVRDPTDLTNLERYLSPNRVVVQLSHPVLDVRKFFQLSNIYPNTTTSKILSKYFQGTIIDNDELAPALLAALLRPSHDLRRHISSNLDFIPNSFLSVHARFGLGFNEKTGRFNLEKKKLTLNSACQCVARTVVLAAIEHQVKQVFVASDTVNARTLIKDEILGINSSLTVITSKNIPKHARWLKKSQDSFQDYANAFVDIGVLSLAKSLVYLPSGFADIALWMGNIRDATQVNLGSCSKS